MRDIAKVAGVSVTTVSYALRGHSSIPPATTARIRKCAQEMGYRANPLVSAFVSCVRHGRTLKTPTTIALLSMYREPMQGNTQRQLRYQGALDRCREFGFNLELVEPALMGLSEARLAAFLRYNNYAGILIGTTPVIGTTLHIDWNDFPVVTLGYILNEPGIDRVRINHIQGIQIAFERLTGLGYQNVALATFHNSSARIRDRYIAAAAICNRSRPRSKRHPVLLTSHADLTAKSLLQWLRKHRVDAFIDAGQKHFGKLLREAGIPIPGEIAYATSNWSPSHQGFAGVDQCPAEVGAAGVDMLISKIYANECGILPQQRTMLIAPRWRDGPSAPPAPGR